MVVDRTVLRIGIIIDAVVIVAAAQLDTVWRIYPSEISCIAAMVSDD